MCGIVGVALKKKVQCSEVVGMLKRLEYRGYDSWGFATNTGVLMKATGEIPSNPKFEEKANVAISHTRWATHGGVTNANAHPHMDCTNSLFVVHNGIIENYAALRQQLEQSGHIFRSQTDTEIIAHYFEEKLRCGKSIEDAMPDFLADAQGTFAVLIVQKGMDRLYAIKRDSPLVMGIVEDGYILASDIYAFSGKTNEAIWLENDEWAVIDAKGYRFCDAKGVPVYKAPEKFEWPAEPIVGNFEHFMIKEIHETPSVANRLLVSLKTSQKESFEKLASMIKASQKVIFVAAGTSYHASLLGVYFLHKVGIEAQAIIASEFKDYAFVNDKTLLVAISQSGETMDVIEALKVAKSKNAKIASIVNVPYSTVQRMSELSIQILAGQEVCVAATKSFINQVLLMLALANSLGYAVDPSGIASELEEVFKHEKYIQGLAERLKGAKDLYVVGRGLAYPLSREIALKLKEISYVHAEGMMAGELKHGTLALIEPGVPVLALIGDEEIISNIKEIEARGGDVIAISDRESGYTGIHLKASSEVGFALAAAVIGQLLTYYIAKERNLPIDKPRNLAKSVTVK